MSLIRRGQKKNFCTFSAKKSKFSSTEKALRFTTMILAVEMCFKHLCRQLPSTFEDKV